jgi:crossover junction endodeoxyribonuclease RuvC
MLIIGVDPGLVSTGVGLIESAAAESSRDRARTRSDFKLVFSTELKPPRTELSQRLLFLHDKLLAIIRKMDAQVMAVEDQFFGNNVQTAFKTGQARGAALLAAAHGGIPVILYSPARVKQAVVGNGRASKEQVQHMVRQILAVDCLPGGFDCSDALAVALCHAFASSAGSLVSSKKT